MLNDIVIKMALYDNKYWLLSHIRNSFISTDDTGMCELVMVGENLPKTLVEKLDCYPDTDESPEEDDIEYESYDIQLDMDFNVRSRPNSAARLEKMDLARKRAAKTTVVKWETTPELSEEDKEKLFAKKDLPTDKPKVKVKSLLSELIQNCTNVPQNPYMEYAKFDGSAQVGIPVRKYKIFLTMLPEQQRNYPMHVVCVATAKIHELIGLICLKCSTIHGDFPLQPVSSYGLYITEDDGEVERDLPCLDAKECVAKFGFTCLGLVEHKTSKNVSFDTTKSENLDIIEATSSTTSTTNLEDSKQMSVDLDLMKSHKRRMEAPLYQSFRVCIIYKMRTKVEIHLGISGEKIEIDPVQQKSTKFTLIRQKAVSHHMDSVAWCDITDVRSSKSTFRVVYSLSFGSAQDFMGSSTQPNLQSSASFKHYDFEADHSISEEIVQKINLILEIRSSLSRKEYLASKEKKMRRKSFHLSKRSDLY